LIERAIKINSPEIFGSNTDLSREVRNRAREVMGECHRLSAFLRLTVYPEMLLYTKVDLVHDTADILMRHFCGRYPTFVIALYCNNVLYAT